MSILTAPLLVATVFVLGTALLLVTERKGERAGHALLGAVAVCTVLGLTVAVARSPDIALGSFAQMKSRTVVE